MTGEIYTDVEGVQDLIQAANHLARTQRGRNALRRVLAWLDDDALGLDLAGQESILTLLHAAWGPYAGTTRDAMRDALE